MIPYWGLFSIFAFASLASGESRGRRHDSRIFMVLAGLLIMLMIGLRYEVGGDWGAYARMFNIFRYMPFERIFSVSSSEPAYSLLNWLAMQGGIGLAPVNLVCAGILAFGVLSFARRQPQPWLCILVATPFLIIVVGMGYTRQSAAVGIFLLALNSLQDRRLLKSVLLVLLAASFHRSAIVALPFIGLSFARNRIQVALLVLAALAIAYYALLAAEWDRLSAVYVEQDYQSQGAAVRLLMNAVPACLFLLLRRRFGLDKHLRLIWTNFAIVALLSFGMIFLTSATVALDRLAIYIVPIQLFVFSRMPSALTRSREGLILITFLIVLYSALVQFTFLNFADNARYWVPYRFMPFETGPDVWRIR